MNKGIGGIFARVSTKSQTELSLDSQVTRAKEKLEAEGYVVADDKIIAVHWTSLDLYSCPDFNIVRQWINKGEIDALAILDRDRLNAQGLQRLTFLTECRDAGIKLLICQGPEIMNDLEGELTEMALAIGKHRSVLRASQGSKDGLLDKPRIKGIPTSKHPIRGYNWDGPKKLLPNEDRYIVDDIYRLALQGQSVKSIHKKYKDIVSEPTIWRWLTNPVYAGRYHARRSEAIAPIKRKGHTYGNSSKRCLPPSEWIYLPDVEVVDPIVTWDEFECLQQRFTENKQYAARNAKRDYLLRSRITCDTHARRYTGRPRHQKTVYICPVGKDCPHPTIHAEFFENEIKNRISETITNPDILTSELSRFQASSKDLEVQLPQELKKLELRRNKNLNAQTELEMRSVRGQVEDNVYDRARAQFRAEIAWIEERKQHIEGELEQLNQHAKAMITLQSLRQRIKNSLDDASNDEWRELFSAINLEIHVKEDGSINVELGLSLDADDREGAIVLHAPEPG